MTREIKQYNVEIADRLRELRISQNISEDRMSEALGVGTDTYYKIERGLARLTVEKLITLRIKFNLDINYLLTGEKENEILWRKIKEEISNLTTDEKAEYKYDLFTALADLSKERKF